ncbi:MAG: putative lipid II flippase FtsW [Micrococcales bacterium]|nr:putative lipid II flippase FtsW [Micrococcales bacterium]
MSPTTAPSSKTSGKASPRAGGPAGAPPRDRSIDEGSRGLLIIGRLESPVTTYYLILGTATTLVAIGLIMVFSASSVSSMLRDGESYSIFLRQALFAVVGTMAGAVAARVSVLWWKRLAIPLLAAAVGLQVLVFTGLGYAVNGNRNWIGLGPISIQPSELAKVALVLVGALVFANKGALVGQVRHAILPFLIPVSVLVLALVLAGHDLGTGLVLLMIIAAVLAVAGAPARLFVGAGLLGAAGVVAMVLTSGNRMARITNWLSPECRLDPDGACGQSVHGLYALADGGWWGVGLGASKEKWSWLPEAHNDFIFAIIGEELGLPGTLMILFLFGMLSWACYRLVMRTQDRFVRIAAGGIMAWLLGQALINIGAVIGVIPVIGVPLPLVSAGGSSLVMALFAIGILLSFARNEPGCRSLLAARPSILKSSLAVLPSRSSQRRSR